jgi:hypothetical protein
MELTLYKKLILMSFFQRVLFNDRLSELDYEIFWKMTWLLKGVTPDKFELVLMVTITKKKKITPLLIFCLGGRGYQGITRCIDLYGSCHGK